jgi:hypothetical protein
MRIPCTKRIPKRKHYLSVFLVLCKTLKPAFLNGESTSPSTCSCYRTRENLNLPLMTYRYSKRCSQCCGSGMFTTGSRIQSQIKEFFFNPKTDTKFSKIRSEMFIPDTCWIWIFFHPGFQTRTQGSKKHRIPDPDPQYWALAVAHLVK